MCLRFRFMVDTAAHCAVSDSRRRSVGGFDRDAFDVVGEELVSGPQWRTGCG
jgi:hypothetical protein